MEFFVSCAALTISTDSATCGLCDDWASCVSCRQKTATAYRPAHAHGISGFVERSAKNQKAVLCWMNTIQYSPEAVSYMQQVFPWVHPLPRRKRHLDRFSRFCTAH